MPHIWDVQYPPRNSSEAEKLVEQWRYWRAASLRLPLTSDHKLHFVGLPTFDFLPDPAFNVNRVSYLGQPPAPLDDTARDAYSDHPRRPYFQDLRLNSKFLPDFEVILRNPISTGKNRFGQVWKADAACRDGSSYPVCVKVFQGSLFAKPEWLRDKHRLDEDYPVQGVVAQREAWAYERLRSAQGTVVAHSYGFYNVHLPCGDVVCAHVTEYIAALSPGKYSKTYGGRSNEEKTRDFMTVITKSIYTLHHHKVAHCDIKWNNMLVPEIHPGSCIIFDFGQATSLECLSEDVPNRLKEDAIMLHMVLGIVASQRQVERWGQTVRADPTILWARPFRDAAKHPYDGWLEPDHAIEMYRDDDPPEEA